MRSWKERGGLIPGDLPESKTNYERSKTERVQLDRCPVVKNPGPDRVDAAGATPKMDVRLGCRPHALRERLPRMDVYPYAQHFSRLKAEPECRGQAPRHSDGSPADG